MLVGSTTTSDYYIGLVIFLKLSFELVLGGNVLVRERQQVIYELALESPCLRFHRTVG